MELRTPFQKRTGAGRTRGRDDFVADAKAKANEECAEARDFIEHNNKDMLSLRGQDE